LSPSKRQTSSRVAEDVFANNPTMCAIVEARRLYGSKDCLIISMGTGSEPTRIDASATARWGDLGWALPMITIFMASSSQIVAVETDEGVSAVALAIRCLAQDDYTGR